MIACESDITLHFEMGNQQSASKYIAKLKQSKQTTAVYDESVDPKCVPEDISALAIEVAHITNASLVIVPRPFLDCLSLKTLNLSGNLLVSVTGIGALRNLRNLNLSNNMLDYLPDDFVDLSLLEDLNLKNNRLTLRSFPGDFPKLPLKAMDLSNNQLESLSTELASLLLRLCDLKLYGNNFDKALGSIEEDTSIDDVRSLLAKEFKLVLTKREQRVVQEEQKEEPKEEQVQPVKPDGLFGMLRRKLSVVGTPPQQRSSQGRKESIVITPEMRNSASDVPSPTSAGLERSNSLSRKRSTKKKSNLNTEDQLTELRSSNVEAQQPDQQQRKKSTFGLLTKKPSHHAPPPQPSANDVVVRLSTDKQPVDLDAVQRTNAPLQTAKRAAGPRGRKPPTQAFLQQNAEEQEQKEPQIQKKVTKNDAPSPSISPARAIPPDLEHLSNAPPPTPPSKATKPRTSKADRPSDAEAPKKISSPVEEIKEEPKPEISHPKLPSTKAPSFTLFGRDSKKAEDKQEPEAKSPAVAGGILLPGMPSRTASNASKSEEVLNETKPKPPTKAPVLAKQSIDELVREEPKPVPPKPLKQVLNKSEDLIGEMKGVLGKPKEPIPEKKMQSTDKLKSTEQLSKLSKSQNELSGSTQILGGSTQQLNDNEEAKSMSLKPSQMKEMQRVLKERSKSQELLADEKKSEEPKPLLPRKPGSNDKQSTDKLRDDKQSTDKLKDDKPSVEKPAERLKEEKALRQSSDKLNEKPKPAEKSEIESPALSKPSQFLQKRLEEEEKQKQILGAQKVAPPVPAQKYTLQPQVPPKPNKEPEVPPWKKELEARQMKQQQT
ncbi:hypothetical protein EDD86DRAFT_205898 [Gorgonomyces haynaldii]|nr:hypothetical protein EDD86DRAFT_205898 [Gorgonomyces haynaldii]